jgi:5-formyltetrahydrofolate cyclo-ligase
MTPSSNSVLPPGVGEPAESGDAEAVARKLDSRRAGRDARRALDPAASAIAARALAHRLLSIDDLSDARLVLVYAATAEEIDLGPTIAALRARDVQIAYPRIEERGVLAMHLIDDEADLIEGPFGIKEPASDAPRPEAAELDTVLVPGVAFDERGARIGFGGGFYDRLLPLVPYARRIGVAFDEQIVEELPSEPHDVVMDVVVTPTRVIRAETKTG